MPAILRVCFPSCSRKTRQTSGKTPLTQLNYCTLQSFHWINVSINISHFSHNIIKVASPHLLVHLGLLCDTGLLVFLHSFKHGAIGTASLGAILVRVV